MTTQEAIEASKRAEQRAANPVGSTGLVARLRLHRSARELEWVRRTLMAEAADRIEELERGIKEIGSIAYNGSGNDEADLERIDELADALLSATAEVSHRNENHE